jgi:hypothetical protein
MCNTLLSQESRNAATTKHKESRNRLRLSRTRSASAPFAKSRLLFSPRVSQFSICPQFDASTHEYSRMRHVLWFDEGVEFFGGYVAEIDSGFAEAEVGVMGGFGDLGCGVVADFGG